MALESHRGAGEPRLTILGAGEEAGTDRPEDRAPASRDPGEEVAHPSRAVRLAYMARSLLAQIEQLDLDEAARHRLASVFNETVAAVREVLSEELQGEVDRLALELPPDPTAAELRVAHAQLVGWLDGLFHGIRTTLIAHELATQEELARAYAQSMQGRRADDEKGTPGQYM